MEILLLNTLLILIIIGIIGNLIEKKIRLNILIKDIEKEQIKYSNINRNISSNSNNLYTKIILIAIGVVIATIIVMFILGSEESSGFAFPLLLLFAALVLFSPYYIRIENDRIEYKHLINTLNKVVVIPIGKIDSISYLDESIVKKDLTMKIGQVTIAINLNMVNNREQIERILTEYIYNRGSVIGQEITKDQYNNNIYVDKEINVKSNNDYILGIIVAIVMWTVMIIGGVDIVSGVMMAIGTVGLICVTPYKIKLEDNKLVYKHIIRTKNQRKEIDVRHINHMDISDSHISYKRSRITYYELKIVTSNGEEKILRLLFEKYEDVKYLVDTINKL